MRVVVTGGTGFIGRHVTRALASRGDDVIVLTRSPGRPHPGLPAGVRLAPWEEPLEGADAVVNLAGETIAQRWTARARERILASRTGALERLAAAVRAAKKPPRTLVSASAVGYYGRHEDEPLTEASPPGGGFLARTCVAWEEAARRLEPLGVRVSRVRFGLVLGRDGGALPKMLPAWRLGLGAPVGSGRQVMSFIHVEDLAALLLLALDRADAAGAINGTAPEQVTMDQFAPALRRALRRPLLVPSVLSKVGSAMTLPLLLGEMSTVLLDGQRVLPERARALGFAWRFPTLDAALGDLVS